MEILEIDYNDRLLRAGIEKGMLTLHVWSIAGQQAAAYVSGVDEEAQTRKEWMPYTTIRPGDMFRIRLTEGQETDTPARSTPYHKIEHPENKLEEFRKLESHLKQKGLI